MAVIFHPDKFVIEVQTGHNPIEDWLDTQNEMLELLKSEDESMAGKRCQCLELLRNMLPDLETAKKMTK